MATRPSTRYPGQSNAADGGYPGGSAKNVNVPGDGTGFPFEKDWVNDIFALLQSMLVAAGVTADDVVDQVGASQYYDALLYMITSRTDPLEAVWTERAALSNWMYQFTDPVISAEASSGRAILWNPVGEDFYSFNRNDSNGCSGVRLNAPFGYFGATLTIDLGDGLTVSPNVALVNPTNGKMVIGGAPAAPSTSRYRSATSVGTTWTARTSPKAADTTGPIAGVYATGTIDKFITGFFSGHIESSVDGETWVAEVDLTEAVYSLCFSEPLNMLLALSGGADYFTSLDGTTWTAQTAPAGLYNACWSENLQKFIAVASNTTYSSVDGVNWVLESATHSTLTIGTSFLAEYKRTIIFINGSSMKCSFNGVDDWVDLGSGSSPDGNPPRCWALAADRGTILLGNYTDGFHMATGRYGD